MIQPFGPTCFDSIDSKKQVLVRPVFSTAGIICFDSRLYKETSSPSTKTVKSQTLLKQIPVRYVVCLQILVLNKNTTLLVTHQISTFLCSIDRKVSLKIIECA